MKLLQLLTFLPYQKVAGGRVLSCLVLCNYILYYILLYSTTYYYILSSLDKSCQVGLFGFDVWPVWKG